MIEPALLPLTNLNLPAAREIDCVDEPAIHKCDDAVIGCNFESNSMGLTHVHPWLDQVLDSNNMKCSRLSGRRKRVDGKGKFRMKNGIESNSVRMVLKVILLEWFQW
jgi:hypothetical protein